MIKINNYKECMIKIYPITLNPHWKTKKIVVSKLIDYHLILSNLLTIIYKNL
jgi:hypothetical protein